LEVSWELRVAKVRTRELEDAAREVVDEAAFRRARNEELLANRRRALIFVTKYGG